MANINQTLYVHNLNDHANKDDTKRCLYALFSAYGSVLDVVALRNAKMRGQAHVVFRDIPSATAAMRSLQGFRMFEKELKIEYARGKSDSVAKLDGTYRLREANGDAAALEVHGTKRPYPEDE